MINSKDLSNLNMESTKPTSDNSCPIFKQNIFEYSNKEIKESDSSIPKFIL